MKLLQALSIGLPRGLKLSPEIRFILRKVVGKMAPPVAMNRAFAEAILSRNPSDRLPGDEPVVNHLARRMAANAAETRHEWHPTRMSLKVGMIPSPVAPACESGHP
jgi:hypothetical protein